MISTSTRRSGQITFEGEEIRIFGSPHAQAAFSKNEVGSLPHLPQEWQELAWELKQAYGIRRVVMTDGKIAVWTDFTTKEALSGFAADFITKLEKHVSDMNANGTNATNKVQELYSTSTPVRRGSAGYRSTGSKPEDFGRFAPVVRAIRAERQFLDTATDEERMDHYRLTAAAPRSSLLNLAGTPTPNSHRMLVCEPNVERPGVPQDSYYATDARVL